MNTRLCKILLVYSVALFCSLVVINNTTDYDSNFVFVEHVLSMDDTFAGNNGMWRSITTTWMHHVGYIAIIMTEAAIALMCWAGGWKLWCNRSDAVDFNRSKHLAMVGLTLGFSLWFVGFMVAGGEWFLMWQSSKWNGTESAAHFVIIIGIIMIFVNTPDVNDPGEG